MKTVYRSAISLAFLLSLFLVSCSDDESQVNPLEGLQKITEGYAMGAAAKLEIWAAEPLFTGYNPIIIVLKDSVTGRNITDAHIHLHPMMYMTSGMNHACPYEDPEEEAVNGVFPASITFVMPTGDMGYWELGVHVHNHLNDKEGETVLNITVASPSLARLRSFTTDDGTKYFISYYFPAKPKVGINDFVVVAYTRQDAMNWPAVNDLTFEMEPEMPSMGHGSPNNVNPVFTTNGHYAGKVNFTMTGDWRIHLSVSRAGIVLQDIYFDLMLE